jgi:VWFA-related protein
MKSNLTRPLVNLILLALLLPLVSIVWSEPATAQSRRVVTPPGNEKKNKRPSETSPEDETQEPLPSDIINKPNETDVVKVSAAVVNIDAVVYHKKSGQIITGLKKENFTIFEDGVKKETTYFNTPEAPITVTMLLEYSKLTDYIGGDRFEPGRYEVLRPMAMFLSRFIKPPDDYVSVVAYDLRATPLTDFTNDSNRINQVINLLLRNNPAFSEANLFDALKLVLIGGKGDAVVLEDSKSETAEYAGMASIQGRRKAVLLVCSGIDTFSKINYGDARKIIQNAGVPIYIIGTGNLFFKKYEHMLPDDNIFGPSRMTFLQAQNTLNTFAKESGGMHFPITFPGELPNALSSINSLLRSQYSLGYNPGDKRDGKQHKIEVKVDVDKDGKLDDKEYIVQARQFYNAPKDDPKKDAGKK